MAKTKTKSGSKNKATCPICGKVVTRAGMVGHLSWKHGKQYKAPLLPSKGMIRADERRKAELWDISHERDKAIVAAADEIEKAFDAGEQGEPFKAHISKVAAHLADSNKVSNDEALKLIHGQVQNDRTPWPEQFGGIEWIRRCFVDAQNPHLKELSGRRKR
jgi:hypothetical protein